MRYQIKLIVAAAQSEVFRALHWYKHDRDPNRFFLGPKLGNLAKMHFEVVTPQVVGLGATYAWRICVLGKQVLRFQEQIVEWEEDKVAGYRAISGWQMEFRTVLEQEGSGTEVNVEIDFSFGSRFLDRMLRPIVEYGLLKVCTSLIRRGLRRDKELEPSNRPLKAALKDDTS